MKNNTGTFSTPQYPNSYPPGQVCKWIIAATPGHVIQILWMNFQLEKSHECMYDYVEIFDNNTETGHGYSIGKYCGHTAPPMLLSTSNLVTIVFRTDGTNHLVGFLATYNIIAEKDGESSLKVVIVAWYRMFCSVWRQLLHGCWHTQVSRLS
jgi:cubilin